MAGRLRLPTQPVKRLKRQLRPSRDWRKKGLKRYVPTDGVILEAGAHIGQDTVELARIWLDGHIHAFEPIPRVYELLERNTSDSSNVKTYRYALGDRTAVEPMYVSGGAGNQSSSLLAPEEHLAVFPEISFDEVMKVEVTTIAAWAEREEIDRVDGMWLDMQGYELAALKAAGPVLDSTRAIVLEVSLVPLYQRAPLWPEVRDWLQAREFHVEETALGESSGDVLVVRD
jgi:FkbM family methyltransferase